MAREHQVSHKQMRISKREEMQIEYIDFEEVERWPRNPKDHDLNEIKNSFVRFGFVSPIIMDEKTGKLVAGHGRLDTLRMMYEREIPAPNRVRVVDGKWLVPVLRGIEFADDKEVEAYILADNRLTEIGGWNSNLLNDILKDLDSNDLLDGTGFDVSAVEDILTEPEELEEKTEKLRPYEKIHVMFSIPIDLMSEVTSTLEEISSIEGIEFDVSKN